jgi:hypothetical protein
VHQTYDEPARPQWAKSPFARWLSRVLGGPTESITRPKL